VAKRPFCLRSYCASSSFARSFGYSRRYAGFPTRCLSSADSNIREL
jgi:hypothetical protein